MPLKLSPQAANRVRQVFIVSGLRQGLSGNEIIDALRAQGLGLRTTTFQSMIRELTGRPGPLPNLDSDTLSALYQNTTNFNFTSRSKDSFVYPFTVRGRDLSTGKRTSITYSVSSPFFLPPQLAREKALGNIDFGQNYNMQVDEGTIEPLPSVRFQPSAAKEDLFL